MNNTEQFELTGEPTVRMATCQDPACGREFPYRQGKNYCNSTCRSRAHKSQKQGGMFDKPQQQQQPTTVVKYEAMNLNGLNAQSQYIINDLNRQLSKAETAYQEERKARKEAQKNVLELKEKIRDMKHEQELRDIQSEKPSGLEGLMQNPVVEQMMPYIGPVLGDIMKRALTPGANQVEGVDNNLMAWISSQSPEAQQNIYALFNELATQSPEKLVSILNQLINLLKNGSTAKPTANVSAAANY